VIVPVVERADDLIAVYKEYAGVLDALGREYEFLFMIDGAFGRPPRELIDLASEDPRVRVLGFEQAFGEAAALRAGIDCSRGDVIVTAPAYFQVQPSGLKSALEALGPEVEMVVTRRSPRIDGWLNRLQSRVFHGIVLAVSGVRFRDMACGLRAMRRDVAEAVPLYGDLHRFLPAMAARQGFGVEEIDVAQHPLDARRRLYGPGIYVRRLMDIIAFFVLAKFIEKPLRFFGLIGASVAGIGALLSIFLLVERLGGKGIANRPLLLLAVLLFTLGVQVIGLGLVGEIIVHLRSRERRKYRVREVT
jgi:glycosyltransferase involved in cell wall biosynthesis